MKIQAYAVFQAEALGKDGRFGIKIFPDKWMCYTVFPTKEDAKNYLATLIGTIKHEQSIGWRTPDNLDPEVSLDFCLAKVTVEVRDENFLARGWTIPEGEDFKGKVGDKPASKTSENSL